jgi:class 3 adenylate cyclase
LAIQARGRELAEQHPAWPRFRIGLNSGEALVGNIGSDEFRSFTAIGDTTNMAQRFQTLAQPGQIVVGPMTAELLGGQAEMASLGDVTVKGKIDPVAPWTLLAVREG